MPTIGTNGYYDSAGFHVGIASVAADVTHAQSSTTLSDITGLLVPVSTSATETWFFEAYLMVSAPGTTADSKFGFSVPASTTMKWGATAPNAQGPGFVLYATTVTTSSALLASESGTISHGLANGTVGVGFAGWIFGGGTAGNVQMQFAQAQSIAEDDKILKGSFLRYTKTIA